jgi:GntR family transcriptional regulator
MIDRTIPIPLYYQIAQELRAQITGGRLAPGEALPTEEVLQRTYGVSRATVRQAIRELASAGLVRLARPRGTFVTEPRLVEELPTLISFSDEVRRAGLTPSTQVLTVRIEQPPDQVRESLRLMSDAPTLHVARLRLADDQPVAILSSWLLTTLGIGPEDDFSASLYRLLAERGATPARAEQLLDAMTASVHVAALLRMPRRAALLVVSRVTYDAQDRPIEYVTGSYRADRYRYSIRLSGAGLPEQAGGGLVTFRAPLASGRYL